MKKKLKKLYLKKMREVKEETEEVSEETEEVRNGTKKMMMRTRWRRVKS